MTATAPEQPKARLGATSYALTDADRAKGREVRARKALERAKAKERQRLGLSATIAWELENRAQEIVDALLKAGLQDGEWRALQALIHQHLGTPAQRVETRSLSVSTTLEELRGLGDDELEARLAALPAAEVDEEPGPTGLERGRGV